VVICLERGADLHTAQLMPLQIGRVSITAGNLLEFETAAGNIGHLLVDAPEKFYTSNVIFARRRFFVHCA